MGRECAPLFVEPYRSIEHGDLLYDEKGLPR
jgi:antitoxin VapB